MVVTCTEYSGGDHAGDADANAGGDRLQGAGSKGSLVGSTPLPVRGGGGGYEGDKASPWSSAPFRIRKLRAGDTLDKQARQASSTSKLDQHDCTDKVVGGSWNGKLPYTSITEYCADHRVRLSDSALVGRKTRC